MQPESGVAIFWDFETARIEGKRSGYEISRNLSIIADQFGVVKSFRAYLDVMNQLDTNFSSIRKQLHFSGVTMVDCPSHSGRDIADKAMIVDLLSFILDQPPPYTIVVATSDNDLCFTLAVLRRRRYKVVLVCPLQRDCESLAMQADQTQRVNWIGASENADNFSSSSPSPSSSSILSYAGFDTRHSVQNSTINGRETGLTIEQSKKPSSLHIPSLKHAGNGVDIGPQPSNGGKTPSPGGSFQDVQDKEKPRLRSGSFPGPFFPPAPSFPLETHPKAYVRAATVHKSVAGRKSPSPQSTEDFSLVDHPHDSPSKLTSHSSPVPTLIVADHEPLAATDVSATSSMCPKVSSHSLAAPVAATQRTVNPPTPTLVASTTDAPSATAYPSVPTTTSLAAAAPITTPSSALSQPFFTVSAPAPTSTTPRTGKASGPATSGSLPVKYRKLVKHLQVYHRGGDPWPKGSQIAAALLKENNKFYESVGVKKWGEYSSQAVAGGIIKTNTKGEISLKEKWMNVSV